MSRELLSIHLSSHLLESADVIARGGNNHICCAFGTQFPSSKLSEVAGRGQSGGMMRFMGGDRVSARATLLVRVAVSWRHGVARRGADGHVRWLYSQDTSVEEGH